MQQLGGLDTTFVYAESKTMPLHVCALMLLDFSTSPSHYSYLQLRDFLANRISKAPIARLRLKTFPLGLARPLLIADEKFDPIHHIYRIDLKSLEGVHTFDSLLSDIAGRPLNRNRPLWEVWVIEGVAENQIVLFFKLHHSIIDGVVGADLMAKLLDLEPSPDSSLPPTPYSRKIGKLALCSAVLNQKFREPFELASLLPTTALRIINTALRFNRRSRPTSLTAKPFTAPRTPFNATITSRRSLAFLDLPLEDFKRLKDKLGVTFNDLATSTVSGALRHYLIGHNILPDSSLIAAVPVSVHATQHDRPGISQLSVMFSYLATTEPDPLKRLEQISAANADSKQLSRLLGEDIILRWTELLWFPAISAGVRLYSSLHLADHHPVIHNLILSNVPGPSFPLFLAGAHLIGIYPFGPITDGAGLNITILSQEDRVGIGIIACSDLVPDLSQLAAAIPRAFADLVDAAN